MVCLSVYIDRSIALDGGGSSGNAVGPDFRAAPAYLFM